MCWAGRNKKKTEEKEETRNNLKMMMITTKGKEEEEEEDETAAAGADEELHVEVQDGFRCHHYDASDAKFTTPYHWQHCKGMEV